jgi:hypothetical protein
VAHMWNRRGGYRILVGSPEGRRPLGRCRRRWKDVKMNLQEVAWGGMNLTALAQDRGRWQALANVVMNRHFQKMRGIS